MDIAPVRESSPQSSFWGDFPLLCGERSILNIAAREKTVQFPRPLFCAPDGTLPLPEELDCPVPTDRETN